MRITVFFIILLFLIYSCVPLLQKEEDLFDLSLTFSVEEGTYISSQNLKISTDEKDADIYYVINKNYEPAQDSYDGKSSGEVNILIELDTTIKAVAIKNNCSSKVVTKTYVINFNLIKLQTTSSENIFYREIVIAGNQHYTYDTFDISRLDNDKTYKLFHLKNGIIDSGGGFFLVASDPSQYDYYLKLNNTTYYNANNSNFFGYLSNNDFYFRGEVIDNGNYSDNIGSITHEVIFIEKSSDYSLTSSTDDRIDYFQNGVNHSIYYDNNSNELKFQ